jgi:hypothetical protein
MPSLNTIVGVPYETGRAALDSAIVQDWLTALGDEVRVIPRVLVCGQPNQFRQTEAQEPAHTLATLRRYGEITDGCQVIIISHRKVHI